MQRKAPEIFISSEIIGALPACQSNRAELLRADVLDFVAMQKTQLPIMQIERQLLDALARERRAIVSAPTGSGKSTQIPQMLLDSGVLGDAQVAVLQPRRLATRMLATWVAQARGVNLGAQVGYQMRLENLTSAATRICYLTEGVLLRRMLRDPMLTGLGAVIFDEFHERHLYGDITLARALQIQESTRPDLIVIVMSATLDVAALQKYLQPCAVISATGRTFSVAIEYLTHSARDVPVWKLAEQELERLVCKHEQGDILIFMPGAYEIGRTVAAARVALGPEFVVLPLHGDLPPREQDAAVARYDTRKVVVATNVAETSLTIEGVRLVIDSGLARMPRYDPRRGINTLLVEKISRAAADQRTGRAGRTAPGHCLRLWTAHEHAGRAAQEIPEIKRLDLAEVILTLKASGIDDLESFRWLEPPDRTALARAERLLGDLGALDRARTITSLGRRMLAFPVHPRYARMLLAAQEFDCVAPVALIAALTQARDLLARAIEVKAETSREELFGADAESDFFMQMRAWRYAHTSGYQVDRCRRAGVQPHAARQVGHVFEQFMSIATSQDLKARDKPLSDDVKSAVQRCILLGFSDQLAKRVDATSRRCALTDGRYGILARASVVTTPLLIAADVREIEDRTGPERSLSVVLSMATAVEEPWLRQFFSEDFEEAEHVDFEPVTRRVLARRETRFRNLVLHQSSNNEPPLDKAAQILAREIAAGRCVLKNWDESVEQWILRVNRLREWIPELGLPKIDLEDRTAIIELICHGATSEKQANERAVLPVVKSWLSPEQQRWIEEYAPARLRLPSGRAAQVLYSAEGAPTLAARIQDLYGINDTLWIARRRVPVRIEVLAPSNRPLQVTENLSVFWRDTYPKLKPQLKRRYPKHKWL